MNLIRSKFEIVAYEDISENVYRKQSEYMYKDNMYSLPLTTQYFVRNHLWRFPGFSDSSKYKDGYCIVN